MHAQDSRLRRVDDGCAEHGAEHAAVADGERSSVHVFHGQFVVAGLQTDIQIALQMSEAALSQYCSAIFSIMHPVSQHHPSISHTA